MIATGHRILMAAVAFATALIVSCCTCERVSLESMPYCLEALEEMKSDYDFDKFYKKVSELRKMDIAQGHEGVFADAMMAWGKCYQNDEDSCVWYATAVIDTLQKYVERPTDVYARGMADMLMLRGYCSIVSNPDYAILNLDSCVSMYKRQDNVKNMIKANLFLTEVYKNKRDLVKSLECLDNLEVIADSMSIINQDASWMMAVLGDMTAMGIEIGDFRLVNHAIQMASLYYERANDRLKAYYLLQRARSHFYQQEYTLAEYTAQRLYNLAESADLDEEKMGAAIVMGLSQSRIGEKENAILNQMRADSVSRAINVRPLKEKILLDGEILISLGDMERARYLLFDSTKTDDRVFQTVGLMESQKMYFKAMDDYKSIYKIQKRQKAYVDSLQAKVIFKNENHKLEMRRFSSSVMRGEIDAMNDRLLDLKGQRTYERLAVILVLVLAFSTILIHLKNSRLHYRLKVESEKDKLRNELADKIEDIKKKEEMIKVTSKRLSESVNYAEHIQRSILPRPEDLEQYDISGSFIFFSPLDIVSGDFYWFAKKGDNLIVCCADCTGHGIPGAFMSMIASTVLSDVCNRHDENIKPSEILEGLDSGVIDALGHNQTESGASKDGCDISVASINMKTKMVTVSSAKRPVIVMKDQEMIEIKGTKRSIGDTEPIIKNRKFTDTEIQLHTGDTLYMFSDGYSDQFGGSDNSRMNMKNILRFIRAIHDDDMDEQGLTMQEFFTQWKGDYPQTDDVLFMGIMI